MPTRAEDDWAFIVELDRAPEPLATIGGKAREYATMVGDQRWKQHWTERFGPQPPRILWVVPNAQRGEQVQRVWQEHWPEGRWYIATLEQVRNDAWQRSLAGGRKTVPLFRQTTLSPTTPISPVTSSAVAGATGQPAATPTTAAPAQATAGVPPGPKFPQEFRLKLTFTNAQHGAMAEGTRVELLDTAGDVVTAATMLGGSVRLSTPAPEQAVRLRLPRLCVELALDANLASLELRLPEPPAQLYTSRLWHLPGESEQWGGTAFERALDQSYHACSAFADRLNKQQDAHMQEAVYSGKTISLLSGWLLAYLSIFPVGLAFIGQCLCVLLRLALRLARAVCWGLGTVWYASWGRPGHYALTALARLLLALTFVVWLPLASWSFYDGELRSWPCRPRTEGATIWAFAEPSQDGAPIPVQPESELRCFTRTAGDEHGGWRRISTDGREAWALDWLVEPGVQP